MSATKKERFKNGPESEQFDKFKGKQIMAVTPQMTIHGKLVWIDVYTMGVHMEGRSEPSIIYKGPGVSVHLDEDKTE